MIDAALLLADGKRLVGVLEDDLRRRSEGSPETDRRLRDEYGEARAAKRTGQAYETWLDERVTQAAVAWVLAAIFARFCEDNGLVADAALAGARERLGYARDRQTLYFRAHPAHSDREYLLSVFEGLAGLPAMGELLDPAHNPLWELAPSADGATAILEVLRAEEPATGRLIHDFTDPAWDTRFLGDLYQDLSDAARKRYALLQTPHFVEAFLLDRTLEPAIDTFGLERATVIDPTCGSGHFLLGAFDRLLRHWQAREPGTPERELVKRSLAAVAGVDLNPFALSIARFRLLVAALKASHVTRLADAPNFHFELAVGDSLLHGRTPGQFGLDAAALARPEIAHVYRTEDGEALARILGRHYAVVVGNPPYVTVKDGVISAEYRQRFPDSCRGKYAASVPFTERFLDLAAHEGGDSPAGYVGMITANSFMKREMGKNLVERVLPLGPDPRNRHQRRLHPRPRNADGHIAGSRTKADARHRSDRDGLCTSTTPVAEGAVMVQARPATHGTVPTDLYIEDDNLAVMKQLPTECIDLIYIDPPFGTGQIRRLQSIRTGVGDKTRNGFGGRVYNFEVVSGHNYRDDMPLDEYLGFLYERLVDMHRTLRHDGSIYLHLDFHTVHFARLMLDEIFGVERFMNEIIWAYDYGGRARYRWARKHDNILWYTKSDRWTFNRDEIDRIPYMAPGLVGAEKAERGKLPTDTWWMTIVPTNSKERAGYPTQKPVRLLERIIRASSNPGDLVADFFAGSGTTGVAAKRLGRRFLLVDDNPEAVSIGERRLAEEPEPTRSSGEGAV